MQEAARTEIAPGEFLAMLRRRRLAVACGALLGVLGAGLITLLMRPVYVAEARLLIETRDERSGLAAALAQLPVGLGELVTGAPPTAAEMEVIRSRPVVSSVVLPAGAAEIAPEVGRNLLVRVEDLDRFRVWQELLGRLRGSGPPAGGLAVEVRRWGFPESFTHALRLEFQSASEVEVSIERWRDRRAQHLSFRPGEPLAYLDAELVLVPEGDLAGRRFLVGMRSQQRAVEEFQKALRVEERLHGSNVVRVSYSDSQPERAAATTNALVDSYLGHNRARMRAQTVLSSAYVENELERVRAELEQAESELVAFGERAGPVALPETAAIVIEKLAEIDLERAQAQFRAGSMRDLLARVRAGDLSPEDLVGFEALQVLPMQLEPLASLLEEKRALETTYTEEWPAMQAASAKIEQRVGSIIETLESELWREEELGQRLDSIVETMQTELQGLPEAQVELIRYKRKVEAFSAIYMFLIGKGEDARIQEAAAVPAVEVIERAVPPLRRNRPKVRIQLLVGLVVGLFVGVGLAFARELRRPVTRLEQLEALSDAPRMGTVPRARGVAGPLPVRDEPGSEDAEAFLVLRSALQHAAGRVGTKRFVVASALRREGRSRTAANLAAALAQGGARVLLVDADLRNPVLAQWLGQPSGPGLGELLRGDPGIAALPVSGLAGLDLLSAGDTAGAADRLWSKEARAALDALTAGYDYCLFDSPALLDGSEALSLAHAIPDVLLVARAEQVDEPAVRQGLERLARGGATARGVILNFVRQGARALA